jgi:hypothetical protein
VFTYRCPGCGKQHSNPSPFVQTFQTRCLRCTQSFAVTAEMIHQSGNGVSRQAVTTAAGVAGAPLEARNNQAITPAEQVSRPAAAPAESTPPDFTIGEEETRAPTRSGKKRKAAAAEEPGSEENEALDAGDISEEERQAALAAEQAQEKAKKKKKKKAEEPPPSFSMPQPQPTDDKGNKKRTIIIAGAAVAALLVLGGGYMIFKKTPKKTVKPPRPQTQKDKDKDKPKPPPKEKPKVEPPKTKPPPEFIISAPRLAVALAADRAATDKLYKDRRILVSGLFGGIEKTKPGKNPVKESGGAFALFITAKAPVKCDMLAGVLAPTTKSLSALARGAPFSVQGIYGEGGVLKQVEHLEQVVPPADQKYRGKPLEVTGTVVEITRAGEYPAIRLEGETNSACKILCVFRKDDEADVNTVRKGMTITVRGDCQGRINEKESANVVRLDTCQFLDTTGPVGSVPRVTAFALARDYDEDLRGYFVPSRNQEERVDKPLTVTELSQEWKANKSNMDKYHYKILTVSGRFGGKGKDKDPVVVLESDRTDQPLKVAARFPSTTFDNLDLPPVFRLRGFCTALEGNQLRLDNCEVEEKYLKSSVPRLTADYFPHQPGAVLVYDLYFLPPAVSANKPNLLRQVWYQGNGGLTQTVNTHTGKLPPDVKDLFQVKENWADTKLAPALKAKFKVKQNPIRLPGPVYEYKASPGMIEFGQRALVGPGKMAANLAPVLKLGVKVGESWVLKGKSMTRTYTLMYFNTYQGRPSAVIREIVDTPLATIQRNEIEHVYAQGIGEVERREWVEITATEKKLIKQQKLALFQPAPSQEDPKDKPARKPMRELHADPDLLPPPARQKD